MPARTHRVVLAVIVVAALVVAAITFGLWRTGRDDGLATRAFFSTGTPSYCGAASWNMTVRAHFSAFIAGSGINSKEGKFLVAEIDVPSGDTARPIAPADVKLVVPSGQTYAPIVTSTGPPLPTAGPDGVLRSELVFDVPRNIGAAKLVFDSGCAHEEWIVP